MSKYFAILFLIFTLTFVNGDEQISSFDENKRFVCLNSNEKMYTGCVAD